MCELNWPLTGIQASFRMPKLLGLGKGPKKSDIYHFGGRGGQQGSIITFYFFCVPYALKIISRH